jgi:hypothetical protein
MPNMSYVVRCRKTRLRSAMLHRGFVTSRSLLINAGICFASAAPIVSSHKIQTSHNPDLGNRSRDICSKASKTPSVKVPASFAPADTPPRSRPDGPI